jgi:hypothetical protein
MTYIRRNTRESGPEIGERMSFWGETESRATVMTSELLLTLASAAAVVIASYVSGAFPIRLGWALFAGIVAAYVLSRGIAKAGSSKAPLTGTTTSQPAQRGDRHEQR